MAFKTFIAAGMMALSMAFVPATAEAKTNVVIGIGTGWAGPGFGAHCWGRHNRHCNFYGNYPGYGYPGYGYPYYARPYYYQPRPLYYYNDGPLYPRRVSCNFARNVVADHGFGRIVARDCRGPVYTFRARKNGWAYIVRVRAANARIIDVQRL